MGYPSPPDAHDGSSVTLYVNLWSPWDSWKVFTLVSPDTTFCPIKNWKVSVNVINMPPDPESRSRVINYFLFALSLTLECLVRQLLNFNTSERNDTVRGRATSLLSTVEVLPVFHSYTILKKVLQPSFLLCWLHCGVSTQVYGFIVTLFKFV